MAIEAACPKCDRVINAPDSLAGQRVKCPQCSAAITIPKPFSESQTTKPPIKAPAVDPIAPYPAPPKPAGSEPTHVVLTDVQIPFDRAVYLIGFWWVASIVFAVAVGVVVGAGMVALGIIARMAT